jgi:hypothetical protein
VTAKSAKPKPKEPPMRDQIRKASGFETESHAYDFRTRNNLKPKSEKPARG